MNQSNEIFELKAISSLKGATITDNRIVGKAAFMGNMDRGGDVIFPGAFKQALKKFLEEGFVPSGHDWFDVSKIVAMPISAKEVGTALECEAEFHSTEYAQSVRQICMERLSKGLSVGLSVGFRIDYSDAECRMWFESGASMAKYIKDATDYDEREFDMAAIKAYKGSCRAIFRVKELYEYSIVTVPMNPKATASAVKTISGEPHTGLAMDEHSESVLTAVKEYLDRVDGYVQLRGSQGRPIPPGRREQFETLKSQLEGILAASDKPVANKRLQLEAQAFLLSA